MYLTPITLSFQLQAHFQTLSTGCGGSIGWSDGWTWDQWGDRGDPLLALHLNYVSALLMCFVFIYLEEIFGKC